MCCWFNCKCKEEESTPPRPFRRPHPSQSLSYDEPDVYPQRTWHTASQEHWTGVYGADFDEMKRELTATGKWERMKSRQQWALMAEQMRWDMFRLGNTEQVNKWAKLVKEAEKNRKREEARVMVHRRRMLHDWDYIRNYENAARLEEANKNARMARDAKKRREAAAARQRTAAVEAERANVLDIPRWLQSSRDAYANPSQTDRQKAKEARKAARARAKKERLVRRTV
jgi:hypothetical protein